MTAGLYFSANDVVLEWAIAFLESARAYNRSLSITLIPFDQNHQRLMQLQGRFDFSVYIDSGFDRLEAIGDRLELNLTPYGRFWFRRFAAFWGPYHQFMYLDCRSLVLDDLDCFIQAPRRCDFELLHYDRALDQVYETGRVRQEFLRARRAPGFLSGLWASRRDLFSLAELERYAEECLPIRDQLNPRNTDQFFLNYCCDRKGIRTGHFAEVLGDMCQDAWARQPGHVYRDRDCYRRWDHGGLGHRKRVPILHWAGIGLSDAMPEAELFYRFRDAEFSWPRRYLRRAKRTTWRPVLQIASAVRRNQNVNRLWRWLRACKGQHAEGAT